MEVTETPPPNGGGSWLARLPFHGLRAAGLNYRSTTWQAAPAAGAFTGSKLKTAQSLSIPILEESQCLKPCET